MADDRPREGIDWEAIERSPEFQELADKKTREILAAWELVEQALGG